MSATINRVVLVGNLTRDPELRALPSGTSVCRLRVACTSRWRNAESGEWEERPNYFDVSVFGASGEACSRFLQKGRSVAIDGRLDWHEWETAEGQRRQSVEVVADSLQFLGSRSESNSGEDGEPVGVGAEADAGLAF